MCATRDIPPLIADTFNGSGVKCDRKGILCVSSLLDSGFKSGETSELANAV